MWDFYVRLYFSSAQFCLSADVYFTAIYLALQARPSGFGTVLCVLAADSEAKARQLRRRFKVSRPEFPEP